MALAPMRIYSAVLIILLSPLANASCLAEFPILAKVEVTGCQPISIGASPSKSKRSFFRGNFPHKQGSEVEGTLIHARVVEENPASLSDEETEGTQIPEPLAGTEFFFVNEPANRVCPVTLPQELTVVVEGACCDRFPKTGDCLVPFTPATIETKPERWFVVNPVGRGG
jgi:hypothetical protein